MGFSRGHRRPEYAGQTAHSLTVVIPTLNEAGYLKGCLESLADQPAIVQVVVADGGSHDGTRRLAARWGAAVVRARAGRGVQIHAGLKKVAGDVILILHADCRLHEGVCGRILDLLQRDPGLVGGAVAMRFKAGGRRQELIAALNNLRTRLTGIAFGDQAQFLRRETLALIGGFPDQMLMEDVELSLRLKKIGRLAFLPVGVTVSERGWRQAPFAARVGKIMLLVSGYLLARPSSGFRQNASDYYRRYYLNPRRRP